MYYNFHEILYYKNLYYNFLKKMYYKIPLIFHISYDSRIRKVFRMKEKREIIKSIRFTPSEIQAIKQSGYSVPEMVGYFLAFSKDDDFEKLIEKGEIETKLKLEKQKRINVEQELENIDNNILTLEIQLERINNELRENNFNLQDYGKEKKITNSIQTTLKYYRKYYNPKNHEYLTIESFIHDKSTYIKQQSTRCGLEEQEFINLLVEAYNESQSQQVLI